MRRLAPILVFAIVVVAFYWALGGPLGEKGRSGSSGKLTQAADATSRPASRALRAESAPASGSSLPSAESEPATNRPESQPESAPSTTPVVVFEVVREDGRPVAGAMLRFQFDGGGDDGITDASGRVEVSAHPGVTAWVQVSGTRFWAIQREVSLDSKTQRIIVPTRSVVAGRVTVGGVPPDEPIEIQIGQGQTEMSENCDEQGRFEFFNLPPDWHGFLWVPWGYELAQYEHTDTSGEEQTMRLDAPNPALDVRLVPLPAIRGRLVRSHSKEPATGMASLVLDAGRTSHGATDSDGRFRGLVEPAAPEATLVLVDSNGLGKRTITVPGPFTGVRDLGDVELGPTRRVRFRVHDHDGRPVAGALAEVEGTESRSAPTDDDGASSVQADAGAGTLRVAKLLYTTAMAAIPEGDTILDVELAAGNTLVIDVRLADGSIPHPSLLEVRLSSPDPMFAGNRRSPDSLFNLAVASEACEVGREFTRYRTGETGRLVLGGFIPGAQLGIELRAIARGQLLDESFVVMDAAGTKTVTLRTQTMPRSFAGLVQARDGSPLQADLFLRWDDGTHDWASTDELGRFQAGGLFTPFIGSVSIEATEFMRLRLKNVAASEGQIFTLAPGRTVRIDLVDEEGRPVRDSSVVEVSVRSPELADGDQPRGPQPLETPGSWIAQGLPDGIVEISATVGTAHAGIRHDSRIPVARLVIPSTGGAEVHWRRDRRDPARCRIRVESVPPGAEVFVDVPDEIDDHYLEAVLPPGTWRATALGLDEAAEKWVVLGSSRPFAVRLYEGTGVEMAR